MRPKARRLAQHGGPTGCLEESDQAGVLVYVIDGPYLLPFPYSTGYQWQELPSCLLMEFPAAVVNVHNYPSVATSRKEGMAW